MRCSTRRSDEMLQGAALAFATVAATYWLWGHKDAWLWAGFAFAILALKSFLLVRRPKRVT